VRNIHPDDLWALAAPSARASLHSSRFGQHAMKELCAKLDHTLSANAQRYLDEVAGAVRRHHAIRLGAFSTPPFEPLYRARRPLNLVGAHIASGHEFHWNFLRDRVESMPRYARANDWEQMDEEE
jgi:hypothetical protein